MKLKDYMMGLGTGIAIGIIASQAANKMNNRSAELVLKDIKTAFKEEGPIDGSWILMNPEPFKKEAIQTNVYKGGISRMRDGELEQFEFAADAKTGTVVELVKM
ncbi:hypothetical protein [Psychrobacillus lasiicapitis]|uniref:PepSY domain-containing protein n=1 Tax=Psychrobacillus lasiicapitis TaxID=1636719 RepID=A0A544T9H1_9BACI|nr:hypothetical protein [Psychrobacillus lasiicapitis]TQR13998.1 hypothetical protein FG382_10365 [Psychrobacillus lasiicapitis]GGA37294.1 hypothetical protein GCM10011384_28670 [Psychrobacillus lasiicapitis]